MKNPNFKFFKVAGIKIKLISDFPISKDTLHKKFLAFEDEKQINSDIVVHHHFETEEETCKRIPGKKALFHNDQWNFYKTDSSWIYTYIPLINDPGHKATSIFRQDYSRVDIYTAAFTKKTYRHANIEALTFFNTDQILFSKPICDRNGMILHANGFNINQTGFLLVGESGAGKSTLSSMLLNKGNEILCDDRMFITKIADQFWIHGNWCHGSSQNVANISAPLRKIFFLKKSKINKITIIRNKKNVTTPMLKSLVKAFYSSSDWSRTLSSLNEMINVVDFYLLEFNLSGEIANIIYAECAC